MAAQDDIWAVESPAPCVEGEKLRISMLFEGVRELADQVVYCFLDDEDISNQVFLSGDTDDVAENVMTARKLTVRDGDDGGIYVLIFAGLSDGVNLEKRKLELMVQSPGREM